MACVLASIGLFALGGEALASPCDLPPDASRVVVRVDSADSAMLEDGSEVALVGTLPPVSLLGAEPGTGPWPPAEATRQALAAMIVGKPVELAFTGRHVDRYGRLLANLYVERNGERLWVQGALVEQGYARAYSLPGSETCFADLIAQEQAARLKAAGHWGTAVFADRSVDAWRALAALSDSFQTVEGTVTSLDRRYGHLVLQLGSPLTGLAVEWTAKRQGGGRDRPDLVALIGRRIRVHGWIEGGRRSRMAIDNINAIEVLAEPSAATTPPETTSPTRR